MTKTGKNLNRMKGIKGYLNALEAFLEAPEGRRG